MVEVELGGFIGRKLARQTGTGRRSKTYNVIKNVKYVMVSNFLLTNLPVVISWDMKLKNTEWLKRRYFTTITKDIDKFGELY